MKVKICRGVAPSQWECKKWAIWAQTSIARVNSALTGGKAAIVDKDILKGKSKKSTKKSKKK